MKKHKQHSVIPAFALLLAGTYILPYGTVQGENGEYTVIDEPDIERDTAVNPVSFLIIPSVKPLNPSLITRL